jgi:hypothetical protein
MHKKILLFLLLFLGASDLKAQEFEYEYDIDSLDRARSTYVGFSPNIAWGPNETFMYEGGFEIATEIDKDIRIGITDLTYTSADQLQGNRHAITFGPLVEYYSRVSESVALQGRVGIPLQIRWGAELDSKLGVQPYAQAGIDFYAMREFSIGGQARVGFVVTEGFVRAPRVLPQSAIAIAGGIQFKYHF